MRRGAVLLIVVAGVLAVWSAAAAPVFRAAIRVDIGGFVPDAHDAAAMMRSRTVVEAALNRLPPASKSATADRFNTRVTVRPVAATRLVEITAHDSDAGRAGDEVTALAAAYIGFAERAAGENTVVALAALAEERRAHERALQDARARLRRQQDAAAAAETYRVLLLNALARRGIAPHLVLTSVIADDPVIQLLKMRVAVLEGARVPIEAAVALARGDLALREAQLTAAVGQEIESAQHEERLIDEEISALQSRLDASAAQAAAAASTAASMAREEAALEANHQREVELRVAGTEPAAPRIVDASVEEDRFHSEIASAAWFAAAIAMLSALLSAALKNRTPRRRYSAVLAVAQPR